MLVTRPSIRYSVLCFLSFVSIRFVIVFNMPLHASGTRCLCLFLSLSLQQAANILLLIAATLIGLLCYFLAEAKQRRAFLEAKQGLEVKMLIEEQSAEQVSTLWRAMWF